MAMNFLKIHFPGKLVFGKGTLQQLPEELQGLSCNKVLLVTIEPLLPQLQLFIKTLEAANMQVVSDTTIVQEPSFADVRNMMQRVTAFNPDVVVGIGGGSVLDVAKLIAALLENEQSLEAITGIG